MDADTLEVAVVLVVFQRVPRHFGVYRYRFLLNKHARTQNREVERTPRNLALPAFGQKTAVGRNLHVSGRGFFALSPPIGYKNLMCEAQRLRRRSRSLVFLPTPVSELHYCRL